MSQMNPAGTWSSRAISPEAISQGDDLTEALEAAEGALQVAIEEP